MNFRPDLAAAVMDDTKTVTRRLTSENRRSPWWRGGCALNVGQDYAICPGRGKHAIGRARVLATVLEPLGNVGDAEARREGFPDAAAFREAWAEINGTYDPDAMVWRVELRAVERPL